MYVINMQPPGRGEVRREHPSLDTWTKGWRHNIPVPTYLKILTTIKYTEIAAPSRYYLTIAMISSSMHYS